MRLLILFFVVVSVMHAHTQTYEDSDGIVIREASGIARIDNKLIIVGDDADGQYFEMEMEDRTGHIIPIDPEKVNTVKLPDAGLALDLEGIDILADGRIVVLSEQLRCLIAKKDLHKESYAVIAEYNKILTEFGNRGLEGLAVKNLSNGDSRIAVLWEGGYPEFEDVLPELRPYVGRFPLKPVIVIHDIRNNETAGRVDKPSQTILVNVPVPSGETPISQRFRGTDLVWHKWTGNNNRQQLVEGFIILLSSENSPVDEARKEYKLKILQRYNLDGDPVGAPLEIKPIGRNALKKFIREIDQYSNPRMAEHLEEISRRLDEHDWENVNWEGLGWFEEGKSVMIIYDKEPMDPPFALIIGLPPEWQ